MRYPLLVLSSNDLDVLIQAGMRAGYSEHRILIHCDVKRRIDCRNND